MRELAQRTRFAECGTELLMLAEGFERLAEQVERWEEGAAAER